MSNKITVTLAIAAVIASQLFVQSANAWTNDAYNYSSNKGCMYRGYPCSEWTRPDSY
jgi:hypothetical protein